MTMWHAHVANMVKHMNMLVGPGPLVRPLNPALRWLSANKLAFVLLCWLTVLPRSL